MSGLDEIRQRKLQELQASQQEELQEEIQLQQQVQQLEAMVKAAMTKDALQRLGNIKIARPEKFVQLIVVLARLLQSGQVQGIDDERLKSIILRIEPEKRQFRIRRM